MSKSIHHATNKMEIIYFAYSVGIGLWFGLRWLLFDRFWLLAIINTSIFYFFVPTPFLLFFAIYQHKRIAALSLILPTAIFLFFWGELFLPNLTSSPQGSAQELKAMSYNVLFSNPTPEAIAESINSASPDVIGFQELTPQIKDSLDFSLSETYPYNTFDVLGRQGVGLLSSYPILSVKQFPFPPNDQQALHAVIEWQDQPIHVFVVHFSANNFFDNPVSQLPELARERYGHRAKQITQIEKQLGQIDAPILLMCDCNFTDTSEAYFRLNKLLSDSFHSTGWGFGHTLHPTDFPIRVQRIDFVWHSDDLIPENSFVGLAGGSDHHPVISTFRFQQ
ncbi:endonuclease/exonuclease/phosphatase family protein [Candidatus Leptofilum sp.]|uniref:endonuclease/exonuclease/phosphatase family protein n=1 Tax=Candidatus Leptofilum sp. TaxID=3241576 RepID=UPI003B5984F0